MKIGIGVTTKDNPERLSQFMANLEANTDTDYKFITFNDAKGQGVRFAKNYCLKHLSDCDIIVLFDDDCYPVDKGWLPYLLEWFEKSGQNHCAFNVPEIHGEMCFTEINGANTLVTYNCGGVFMAFTKKVLEVAGYMRPDYRGYGWEHLGYSQRIFRFGLTINPYICPAELGKYIFSQDYDDLLNKRTNVKEKTPEEKMVESANRALFIHEASNLTPKRVEYKE